MVQFQLNDGGRLAAGFKGKTPGDCVCRAVAIAAELPYKTVYDRLADGNANQRVTRRTAKSTAGKRTARNGILTRRKWFKDYMAELGFMWVPLTEVGKPAAGNVHTALLPSNGRVIVKVRRHYCTIINGVLHDAFDSRDSTVYGYWLLKESERFTR